MGLMFLRNVSSGTPPNPLFNRFAKRGKQVKLFQISMIRETAWTISLRGIFSVLLARVV